MPMHMTATPVTIGGNILLSLSLGTKARKISRKEQIKVVPSILPYASYPSTPSAFMSSMAFWKMGRKVNEVPSTESTPVPSTYGVPGILNWRQLTMVNMPARMRDDAMAYCTRSTLAKGKPSTLNLMVTRGGVMRPAGEARFCQR